MNANEISTYVVNALSTLNENNEVVGFDLDTLDAVIAELRSVAKDARVKSKDDEKAKKDADKAELAERGKIYYDSLNVGDEFEFRMASGNKFWARKIETKSNTGMTAACELVTPPDGAKNTKRYPKFSQVVVPTDFVVDNTTENVA